MRNNNVILIKGIDASTLEFLLDENAQYSELENVTINYTASGYSTFVLYMPETFPASNFIDFFSDIALSEEAQKCKIFGWFIADDNIYRAKSGTRYMMTAVKNREGLNVPLIVDESGVCYLNFADDDTEEYANLYEAEDDKFIKEHVDSSCISCIHKTSLYSAQYHSCNLPKITSSEEYKPAIENLGDNRVHSFFLKYLGDVIGNWLYKFAKDLGIILLFGSSLFGFMFASDVVSRYNVALDALLFVFVVSIIISLIRSKGINKDFLLDVWSSFISCFVIVGCLCFIVFGLNKYTGKDTTQEVRVKVKDCSEHTGRHSTTYLIGFTLPTSKGYSTYDVGGDRSYMRRDSCTVVYHTGCFGMDVIDDVKH